MIAVGDVIRNFFDKAVTVTSIEVAQHGLLVKGDFVAFGDDTFEGFIVPELAPIDKEQKFWYGWAGRSTVTLPNGQKVGVLSFCRYDPRDTIEDYEVEFAKTIAAMKPEMGMKPLPAKARQAGLSEVGL